MEVNRLHGSDKRGGFGVFRAGGVGTYGEESVLGNTPAVEAETKRGETKQEITTRVSGVHLKPGDFKTFDDSP